MNEVQRLALEICQKRTDLSDEKKERISKMLMEPRIIEMSPPTPSTSSQRLPGMKTSEMEELRMSRRFSSDIENVRMSRRFSKNRKIFGSDMCQNLGEMKREKRWPTPSAVLAALRNKQPKPKLSRQLSDIVASQMMKEGLIVPDQLKYNSNNNEHDDDDVVKRESLSDSKANLEILDSENSTPNRSMLLNLPENFSNIDASLFTPFKYRNNYTLRDVYRDLTLMRRAVSACLTTDNSSEQMLRPVSESNSVEIKIDSPSHIHDKSLKMNPQLEEDASTKTSTTEVPTKTQSDVSSGERVAWENGKQSQLDNTNKPQVENSERNQNENPSGEQTVSNGDIRENNPGHQSNNTTDAPQTHSNIKQDNGKLNKDRDDMDKIEQSKQYPIETEEETMEEKTELKQNLNSGSDTESSMQSGKDHEVLDGNTPAVQSISEGNENIDFTSKNVQDSHRSSNVAIATNCMEMKNVETSGDENMGTGKDGSDNTDKGVNQRHDVLKVTQKDVTKVRNKKRTKTGKRSEIKSKRSNDHRIYRTKLTGTTDKTNITRERNDVVSTDYLIVKSKTLVYDNIYEDDELETERVLEKKLEQETDSNGIRYVMTGNEEHITKHDQNVISSYDIIDSNNHIDERGEMDSEIDKGHGKVGIDIDDQNGSEGSNRTLDNSPNSQHGGRYVNNTCNSISYSSDQKKYQIVDPANVSTEYQTVDQTNANTVHQTADQTKISNENLRTGQTNSYTEYQRVGETNVVTKSHRHQLTNGQVSSGRLNYDSKNRKTIVQRNHQNTNGTTMHNGNTASSPVVVYSVKEQLKQNRKILQSKDYSQTNGYVPAKSRSKDSSKYENLNNTRKQQFKTESNGNKMYIPEDRPCRCCHRHKTRGQTLHDQQPTQNKYSVHKGHKVQNTYQNDISCGSRLLPNQVIISRKSQPSRQIDTNGDKLCKRKNEITKETSKAYRKNGNNNLFDTCFTTLIRPNTQSLTTSKDNTNVSMENASPGIHRNQAQNKNKQHFLEERDRDQKGNMSYESGVKFADKNIENEKGSDHDTVMDQASKIDKIDKKDTQCNSEDEHDSVLDDNGEEDVFNNENEGDDKHRPRKSVMLSRNSCKSRTEMTLSSALSNRTPYSEYDYPEKEIAADVISTIIDDVIDLVWQANVSKFKHHVCKTDDLLGDETVGCIVLIDEVKQSPFPFSCKILNPSSYPATVDQYEILIGNIVEIDISDEHDLREGHVKVAVPFNKSNMRFFHEPVLRTFDPNSNTWTSIDSFENIYFDENDSDLSVLETNITETNVYVVVARPTTEHITFNDTYVEHDSRIDSDVTVSSPIGSRVRTKEVEIKFTVLPVGADIIAATRDSPDDDTLSLVGSSPIIILEQNIKNPQPIFVNLPCERPRINALKSRLSSAPSPEDSGYYTQSRLSKMNDFVETWTETESHLIRIGGCDRVKCELMTFRDVTDDNKVTFCIHEQKTTCFVVETRKEASRPNIPNIALQLLKVFEYQRVSVSVMQNKNMIQDLTVTCDLRSKYATRWRRRLEQDYDITSKLSRLKEGDLVSINLRGNLTSIGKRFHIFRFHGSQSIRVNWNLQVVDKYSQNTLDFYYGFVQLLNLKTKTCGFEDVKTIEGYDWDILLEIPVRLPKHQIGSIPLLIKTKLQVIEQGPVTLQFLGTIAGSLSNHWMAVAQTLQISNARLQSLRRQNRNSDKQLVKDLLFTWFKNMPHAREKSTMLIDVLRKCGKHEMAEKLHSECDKYNNEKTKIATEHNVEKTLKTIIKSPYIIAKWKELATELGFSLENINDIHNSGNSEQDRCLNMLIKWTHKEKHNWLRSLARCVKRIGCKYVADHLLSILVKQNQLS